MYYVYYTIHILFIYMYIYRRHVSARQLDLLPERAVQQGALCRHAGYIHYILLYIYYILCILYINLYFYIHAII